jgi:hypothetical protein
MRNYRRPKAQENKTPQALRQLTLHQLQLYTITMKPMDTFKKNIFVIHLVMPATYVIDYGI